MMDEYFVIINKGQKGPYSIDQLKDLSLTGEDYVWTNGMEDWKKLRDLPELFQKLRKPNVPPPPPVDIVSPPAKTEITGHVNVTTLKKRTRTSFMPSKKVVFWFIIWCSFNLFALIMASSGIDFFSKSKPKTDKFWPFVEITYTKSIIDPDKKDEEARRWREARSRGSDMISVGDISIDKTFLNGIFYHYDYTEFLFYVGGAFIAIILIQISKSRKQGYD